MKKPQNKHSSRYAKSSSALHASRSRIFHYPTPTFARKFILVVIALAILAVGAALLCSLLLNDEAITKSQISTLATDYYENYFYPRLTGSENFQQLSDPATAFDKYHLRGLDTLSLNDLLLYDHQKNASYSEYLSSQCDVNATRIKIYPDPPYDIKSYHIEYTYYCNF